MDLYFNASFGLAESCKLSKQNSDPCHSKHTYIYIYIYIYQGSRLTFCTGCTGAANFFS